MSQHEHRGISRQGLDSAFEVEETNKSNLILKATLMREQGQEEAAATLFAEAAEVEERLGEECFKHHLLEKSFVHRFSAASCWAQAGNFYQAIVISEDLLASADLPERLRQRLQDYVRTLRARRTQWYAELVTAAAGSG
jgi:hypothetical protein